MRLEFTDMIFCLEREIDVESGKVKVKIPAGMRDGMEIKFSGKGMPGPDGVPNGDLYLTVRVRNIPEFVIMGDDILLNNEVGMDEATLVTIIDVPVVDVQSKDGLGKTKLKLPGGTQYDSRFLKKGKGMPKLHGRGQGNVIIQILVRVPERVNKKQRDILESF